MGTAAGLRTLFYRPLQPEDFVAVKAAHAALFPIDYDDNFYYKATNGLDRIWSCAAFAVGPLGEEQLAGFITAKIVHLHECDISDRQHMGLLSPLADHDHVMYILTLGVLEAFRQQGVASHLIGCVCRHAHNTGCRAVFLHVISYNAAAMSLYDRAGFTCVARMPSFYVIATGRQPDPSTQVYDAFLYVLFTGLGGPGQAGSWDLLTIAWSPLKSALGRIHSCMPQFCRSQAFPGSSSTATCGGTACSATAGAGAAHRSSSCNSVNSYSLQQQQQAVDLQQPQQQLLPPYSRHRHRHRPQSPSGTDDKLLLQQQQQQQQSLLLPPVVPNHAHLQQYQQQWQQQHQYMQQERRVQHHHHRQQQQAADARRQQQRTSPQRVLHWLFNGSSRAPGAAAAMQGYQQTQQQEQQQGPQQQQKEEP